MNREWSELNKTMQTLIKKKDTYRAGTEALFDLRGRLADTITSLKSELGRDDFDAAPYKNAKGENGETIAYSLWHTFRIEDITAHTLICGDEQVFFKGGYGKRTGASIITTGNELYGDEIAEFSRGLNLDELYSYIFEVKESTEEIIRGLPFDCLKNKITAEARARLEALNVVSNNEKAVWLIDYWCGKDVRGIIQMPFSRHWIMHVEDCMRIKNKIRR